jgi:HlyD family secretion protein
VSVTGKIQPEKEVKISPDVSGEITEMLVQEGDSVVKGQLLLRINPEIYESTLSQLKANLDNSRAALAGAEAQELRAKTALETAKITFDRQKKLFESQVISSQEWENAQLQFEQAKTEAVSMFAVWKLA